MKQRKLLVCDVDGTLFDLHTHTIPASAITAIRQARINGYRFVIASGRVHYGLGKALNALKPDDTIAVNGAVLVNQQGQLLAHHDLCLADIEELCTFARHHQAGLLLKGLEHMYIYQYEDKIDWIKAQRASDIGDAPFCACPTQDIHLHAPIQSASIHADPNAIAATFAHHPTMAFLPYSENGFDVVPKGIHKGIALQELMRHYAIDPADVVCIGDNYNDLEMMKQAGYAIAMGNAVDTIKAHADFITTPSHQDGIYHALAHLGCLS
ncbi:MAG: HAD family hydrolase [Erysipelotrichaceae bacterium]|nr:HAD family hydrolase [Erysipelotrichaceae bacterium]